MNIFGSHNYLSVLSTSLRWLFAFGRKMSPNRIVGGYQLLAQIKGYGSGSSRLRAAAPSHRLRPPLIK